MEKVANTESTGNTWTEERALDAGLRFLAIMDNADAALFIDEPVRLLESEEPARRAAAAERLRVVGDLGAAAQNVAREAMCILDAEGQSIAARQLRRLAGEIRVRLSVINPRADLRLSEIATPYDAPEPFRPEHLTRIAAALAAREPVRVTAGAPWVDPSEVEELNGHFARAEGSPLPAIPSLRARAISGLFSATGDPPKPVARKALPRHLAAEGAALRRKGIPPRVVALRVFILAALSTTLHSRARRYGETGFVPRLVALGEAMVDGAPDDPAACAKRALALLGLNGSAAGRAEELRALSPSEFLRRYRNLTRTRDHAKVAGDFGMTADELHTLRNRALAADRGRKR